MRDAGQPTLRLDERLIKRAKEHVGPSGKLVSQMVAEYFSLTDAKHDMDFELSPTTGI